MKKILNKLTLFGSLIALRFREAFPHNRVQRHAGVSFANIGEGTFADGRKTYFGDAVTTQRYLLYKIGSDGDHVAVTGAGDTPLGPSDDMVADVTVPISINLLGAGSDTVRVITDGTVLNGSYVTTGASGQVTLAVTTNLVIGRAIIGTDCTSAAGDVITIIPILPGKHPF